MEFCDKPSRPRQGIVDLLHHTYTWRKSQKFRQLKRNSKTGNAVMTGRSIPKTSDICQWHCQTHSPFHPITSRTSDPQHPPSKFDSSTRSTLDFPTKPFCSCCTSTVSTSIDSTMYKLNRAIWTATSAFQPRFAFPVAFSYKVSYVPHAAVRSSVVNFWYLFVRQSLALFSLYIIPFASKWELRFILLRCHSFLYNVASR